ncbi:phosphatidate cytidylyltransferase [Mucilaginibacter xinganensis]|uniref:Phosphatidate cytidylyltransferase n=1 Tax=Mucilaginibacter xinganensis TaxID=1234841 RepID=A0A223NRR2_9SPHI|nr:phosphatidate cytidylyltransferase [Mucilaginibacter xinganensis]ASU32171.1 phosphatidate cytidylyltransferase [Mucilaginibacter xinganensis]
MKTRAITGFFFVVVMLASVLCGRYVFSAFYLLVSILCLHEFYKLIGQSGVRPNMQAGMLNGVLVFVFVALQYYTSEARFLLVLLTFSMALIFIQELYKPSPAPFTNIAFTFLGIIFTVVPFSFFHALAFVNGSFNFHFPLAFLLMLWTNDTGAYLSGRFLGKHKLFERHSPKKTWEGFIGGVLLTVGTATILSHYFTDVHWLQWASMALYISLVGTFGDLVESMLKRSINIKDSGSILPGHGGLLDRFDGLLLAAPLVFAFLYLFFI